MRSLFLLLCLSVTFLCLPGIRGIVLDATDKSPVVGATVVVLDGDSTVIVSTMSDAEGSFSISDSIPSAKAIRISSVGYDALKLHDINEHDLGILFLSPSSNELSDVTVTGERRSFDATTETIYFTDSIRASAPNAAMMIGNLPGLKVDWSTEEISIGSDHNVPVIVNGRNMGAQYARSINPKRIKLIQIQRYPPGEFSKVPVLINIVLFEEYIGWDVALRASGYTSLRHKPANSQSAAADLTFTTRDWSMYLSGSYKRGLWREATSFVNELTGKETESSEPADYRHPNERKLTNTSSFSAGVDRRFGRQHVLSLQTWLDHTVSDMDVAYGMVGGGLQRNINDYVSNNSITGLFYRGNFNDRVFLISSLQYNYYNIDERRVFSDGISDIPTRNKAHKDYLFFSTLAAWRLSSKWSLQFDYSYTWRKYNSTELHSSNRFYSGEARNKARLLASFSAGSSFNVIVGAEMLATKDRQDDITRSRTSVMPWLQMMWRPARFMRLNLNYQSWVDYPNLDQLSSSEWQVSAFVMQSGNPALRSRIVNYLMPSVTFLDFITLRYMFRKSDNDIIEWYDMPVDGIVRKTFTNCSYTHQVVSIFVDRNLSSRLRLQLAGYYQWYRRWASGFSNHGRTWEGEMTLTWNLGKDRAALVAEYFIRHDREPLPQGINDHQQEALKFSYNQILCKGKLPVTVTLYLPVALIGKVDFTRISIPGFFSETRNDYRTQNFTVSFSVRFNTGNGKVMKMGNSYVTDQEK